MNSINPIRFDIGCALHYLVDEPSDFVLNIEVAITKQQHVLSSFYNISNAIDLKSYLALDLPNRLLRFSALPGPIDVNYNASVSVMHHWAEPSQIRESTIAELPHAVLPYLLPSRYCESDKLAEFAKANFGNLAHNYARAQSVSDWVYNHIVFTPGASCQTTSAVDTWANGKGVCRDFAHLTIAILRALNIPARFVAGYDYGADISLGPTDFHAYVEAFIGDRWFIFDSTRICPRNGLVRIGTGFDAASTAFATIFGATRFTGMELTIKPFDGGGAPLHLVDNAALAVSTDSLF